jgi:hypothetical protein
MRFHVFGAHHTDLESGDDRSGVRAQIDRVFYRVPFLGARTGSLKAAIHPARRAGKYGE